MEETIHSASANSFYRAYIFKNIYSLAILIFFISVLHSTSSFACPSPTTSFPISEDFEANAFANWTHDLSDDFDWRTHTGSTTSGNTGPTGSFNGSYYAYTEATSPNNPNMVANLISPCFSVQADSATYLSFAYHMYGAGMGSFNVDVSTDDGFSWTNLWGLSGDQGNEWNNKSVSLAGYEGQAVKLRFNVITGTYQSDVSIDDVVISNVPGCSITNPFPGFPIDFLNNNTGWLDYDLGGDLAFDDNGDGTMNIAGSINNGTPVDFGSGMNGTSCGGTDGWNLSLTLSDKMSWTEWQAAGGSANLNGNCGGSEADLDFWNATGTLTGTGCNLGRTITITGPKSPYRFQIGNGGNSGDNTCAFGMSTWFDLNEGGTAYNADIYAFIEETCYNTTPPTSECNLLSNIEFDNGTSNWTLSNTSPAAAILSIDNTSQLSGTNSAFIDITNSTGTNWHTQFNTSSPLSIDASKTYDISFEAKATASKVINVSLQQSGSPYTTYYYSSDIAISTTAQTYSLPNITVSTTASDAIFKMFLNIDANDIWIDNVALEEVGCAGTCSNDIAISNVAVSSCIDHPLRDVATVSMDISWSNAPSNEDIYVTIGNKTEQIDIPGGATSPFSLTFNVIADGTANNTINATWETTTGCDESAAFNSPSPCSSDEIICDILYLCGLDKPYDGEPFDHGWIEYLDEVNGSSTITPILTKDESGMGTYDPMDASVFININLADYDLIIISATTEGHISSDLINAVKDLPSGLLNGNYLLTDDLGLSVSNGGTTWGTSAYIDNTNQEEIYNYDNPNGWSGKLFTTSDYESYGDGYLWGQSNGMTNTNHGISVAFTASDALPGISSAHGARVSFGYHMNGLYANNDNNGILPSPVSAWFTPENHLTLIGKEKFDEAILLAAAGCCPDVPVSVTGPTSICEGFNSQLSPTTGGTWSSNDISIATVTNAGVVTGVSEGSTTFVFTNSSSGCTSNATLPITVNDVPTVGITGPTTICVGSTTTLTPMSGGSWTSSNIAVATVSNAGIVTAISAGTATFTFTTSQGCVSGPTETITVDPSGTITISGDNLICEGETTQLTASSGGGTWLSSNTSIATVNSSGMVTAISAGSVTITYQHNSSACAADPTFGMVISDGPTVSIVGPADICVGSITTLSPSTGGEWTSSDSNIAIVTNSGIVSGVAEGKVVLIFTETASGCSTVTSDSITVNPDLNTSINFNGSLCLEDDSQLSVDITGGTANFQYNWTGPSGFSSTDAIINITINGNYNVTVTDAAGCSSNTTAFVYEQYEPFIFTLNSEVCEGEDVTLSVNGASGGSYQWDANAGNATSSSVTVTPGLPSTSYTVTVTNSIGCTTSATAVIDVIAKPTVAITGPNDICVGVTTQLSPSSGGIWTSTDYSVANVSNTGLVTGLGNGSVTFTFKDDVTGCFSDPTAIVTVNDNATVTITGDDQICMGESPTLTASVSGGSWSSSNTSVATINSSTGVITTVAQGNAIITLTTPSTSCYLNATYNINIYDTPTLTINGPTTICEGSITYLSASTSGTWTSSDESVAVISTIGEVTGVGPGSATFSFVSVVGCPAILGTPITVIANPVIALTGPSDICINETTTLTPASGGVWISSNTSIATISNSGVVTGISEGNASFTFIESTYGCVSENNLTVSVNAPPNITAPSANSLCIGETASITPTNGGTWASSNTAIATIANDGTITALSSGSVTFAFTSDLTGCTSAASTPITVQPTPTINFSGPTSICKDETTTIVPSIGGVWSSTDVSIATITNQGLITGISPGDVQFIFTNTNSGCVSDSSNVLTVTQPAVVSVSGPTNICVGQTSSLSPSTGGVWFSSNTSIATVTNAGIVTGISAGSVTFIFQNGSGCNSEPTEDIMIDPNPIATFLGVSTICIGEITTLSPSTGGTWSSSNLAVATITNSGVATAISAGSVTLTYTNTSTGCTASADSDLTVNAPPSISIIGGDEICIGNNTYMSPSTGGAWISSNSSIASITANGTVTGISAGDVTFTFIESASGCTSEDSAPITILPRPTVSISGFNTICVGTTTNLSPSTGGVWTSDNESVATVTNGGVVTGISQGLARFTFTTTQGCASNETAPVIVFDSPSVAIDGPSSICIGDLAQIIPSFGGTWTSANPAIASIDNAGVVTALTSGTTTFTYTDSNTGCISDPSEPLTIEPIPVTSLTGPSEICIGNITNMTPSSGGTWTSLNPQIASIQNNGEIVGLGEGVAKFIFMNLTTGCFSDTTSGITVLAGPDIMFSGPTELCLGDTTYILPSSGGTWESNDVSVATISNAGMIIGMSAGSATFQFTETSSNCKSGWSEILTVNGAPTVGIAGPNIICINSQTNLSPSSGGTWVSLTPSVATTNANGLVTGLIEGTAYFQFTDDYTGCITDGSLSISVQASPQIEIIGSSNICLGYTISLSPSIVGIWTSSNPAIASVSNTGVVTGLAPGVVTFQFMDPVSGCTSNGSSDPITITNCTNHDFNVTIKDQIVYGDLNTNDKITGSVVYGGVIETISKPLASIALLTVNTDGTYSFEGSKAGKYLFKVPVCLPPIMAGCEGTLLEINVIENVYVQRNLVSNLEFTTTYSGVLSTNPGTMVIIDAIANDTCVYAGTCLIDESSIGVIGSPSNGTVTINGDFKIEYTPNANFVGLDTIDYTVCLIDGITCSQSQEIIIVNHMTALNSTVANDDFYFTMRETAVSGNVMQNDYDPEGETIAVDPVGTPLNPVTIPEGSYYINSSGYFTFTPSIDFVGTANIVYTICDNPAEPYCIQATIHLLVLNDLSLNIRVYLEGALMNNSGAETQAGIPLMRDDLRVSPFTGENYIPITDPYSIGNDPFFNTEDQFTQVGPGLLSKNQLITDSLGVFGVEGDNAIVDWVHVEMRLKSDSTQVFATRSGLLQRDGDVVDVDGVSNLRFQGIYVDSFYVVVKHRSHLGVMSQLVANDVLIDFTDIDYPVYNYGTSYGNGFDYDGLSRKNSVVYGYSALWAGDFDANGTIKFTNPEDDQNILFLGVLFSSPDFLINYDNAYGYLTSDFDMNSKSKYTNPNDDLNFLFSQILLYPLNSSFLSNFSSLVEQIPE